MPGRKTIGASPRAGPDRAKVRRVPSIVLMVTRAESGRGDTRGTDVQVPYPDLRDWQTQAKSFQGIAGFANRGMVITDDTGAPERYQGPRVTSNFFSLIGQRPMLGRDFRADEDRPGAQSKRFEHIRAAPDAAVEEHVHVSGDSADDLREPMKGSFRVCQSVSTVI